MRVVIQRVSEASVRISNEFTAQIGNGLLLLLGIEISDTEQDCDWLIKKISALRIFPDEQGVMNRSVLEVQGEVLVVSQFTLHASTKKGNRPSYIKSARPEQAIPLYEYFKSSLQKEVQKPIKAGVFGANMQVALINDGPVTILIDSKSKE